MRASNLNALKCFIQIRKVEKHCSTAIPNLVVTLAMLLCLINCRFIIKLFFKVTTAQLTAQSRAGCWPFPLPVWAPPSCRARRPTVDQSILRVWAVATWRVFHDRFPMLTDSAFQTHRHAASAASTKQHRCNWLSNFYLMSEIFITLCIVERPTVSDTNFLQNHILFNVILIVFYFMIIVYYR